MVTGQAVRVTSNRPAPGPRRLLAITVGAQAVIVLPFTGLAAMAVQIRDDIDFGDSGLGLLLALFSVGALLSSPAVGFLIERVGPSTGLRISVAITAIGALGLGLLARSWWTCAAFMMLSGCAAALSEPATNLWIARAVPTRRHGTALGLKQASGPLASVVSGLFVPLVALTIGWRWACVMMAVMAVGLLAVVPAVVTEPRPESRARPTAIEHRLPLALLMTAAFFAYLGQVTMQVFFVTGAVERGTREGVAGILLSVGSMAAVGTRLAIGVSIDRRPRSLLRLVTLFLVGGSASCVVLAFASPIVIVVATPLLFAVSSGWPGLFHLAAIQSYPDATAKVTGLVMSGAFAAVLIGPITFGAIAGASFAAAWVAVAACYLIAAAVVAAARVRLRATIGAAQLRAQAIS